MRAPPHGTAESTQGMTFDTSWQAPQLSPDDLADDRGDHDLCGAHKNLQGTERRVAWGRLARVMISSCCADSFAPPSPQKPYTPQSRRRPVQLRFGPARVSRPLGSGRDGPIHLNPCRSHPARGRDYQATGRQSALPAALPRPFLLKEVGSGLSLLMQRWGAGHRISCRRRHSGAGSCISHLGPSSDGGRPGCSFRLGIHARSAQAASPPHRVPSSPGHPSGIDMAKR